MKSLLLLLAVAAADEDVVIVGAGVSGLTTAYKLIQLGVPGSSITLIEQRSTSGGRVLNSPVPGFPQKHIEVGGTWIGSTQYRVAALANELGLSFEKGDFFHTYYNLSSPLGPAKFLDDDGKECVPQADAWPAHSQPGCTQVAPVPSEKQLEVVRRLRLMAAQVGVEAPWNSGLGHLDNVTVLEWLKSEGLDSSEVVSFLNQIIAIPLSTEISKLSMLFYLFFEASCPSLSDSFFIGGAQDYRFTKGSAHLPDLLRENVTRAGATILWNTTVRRIVVEASHVELLLSGPGGSKTLQPAHAVVAMGTGDAARLSYQGLTPQREELHKKWVTEKGGMKFFLVYETAFWRPPFSPKAANIPAYDLLTRSMIFFDYSDKTGVPGVLAGFFSSEDSTAGEREFLLASTICANSNLIGLNQSCNHIGYHEQLWDLQHPAGGTSNIVQHMPPGLLTAAGEAWRRPIGRLHWAGSDTAQKWMGYIDGAVESGYRAADEVFRAMPRTAEVVV